MTSTSSADEREGTVDRAFRIALYGVSAGTWTGGAGGTGAGGTGAGAVGVPRGADADAALDTGASLLAADPAADAELGRRGRGLVAAAWRRGWQPADLLRFVRRELGDVHAALLAELVRAQGPEDRPRGRRWSEQVAALPAGARPRTDRFTHATAVLELYRLLLRIPALEPLEERTREPRRRGASDSRALSRIRGLLAKAEATGFPEEAEALTAKAQELMARHAVDEAMLAAHQPDPDAPGARRIGVEPPYEQAKAVLLDAVATANHCRSVWNEPFGFSTVVGFEADLDAVELLHTSLLVQAQAALAKAEAVERRGGRKRTKTFRQSFLASYAQRIGARLASAADRAAAEVGRELLPVLASREVAVTAATDRMFPQTVSTRLRGVSDAAGWNRGAEAADRARMRARPRLP
ncbi:DUF2786 domain-containing protein [Streptomyces sp. MS06]|uniref:DUF2786 domain-containing protein n=1 Tax=Streptomyces sp. MS06 TaxID=3385974 RepID=UPI0039A275AA